MKIIVQKTSFYLDDYFFNEIITRSSVEGVSLSVVFNKSDSLLVYNYTSPDSYAVQKFQNTSLFQLKNNNLLSLEKALMEIQQKRKDLAIYLNMIPISVNITDDASLEQLNELNALYIERLEEILKKFPDLNISLHSISRNFTLLLQKKFIAKPIGIVIYAGDLTPTDVDYYVFSTAMIDNAIFEELLKRGKKLIIYIDDENDLAIVAEKYNSEKTTALSSKIFPYLNFMGNQPILLEKVLH